MIDVDMEDEKAEAGHLNRQSSPKKKIFGQEEPSEEDLYKLKEELNSLITPAG